VYPGSGVPILTVKKHKKQTQIKHFSSRFAKHPTKNINEFFTLWVFFFAIELVHTFRVRLSFDLIVFLKLFGLLFSNGITPELAALQSVCLKLLHWISSF